MDSFLYLLGQNSLSRLVVLVARDAGKCSFTIDPIKPLTKSGFFD